MKTQIEISDRALKLLFRLSGLRQDYVAKKLGVTVEYLSYILNGKRKATKTKKRIYDFLLQHNSLTEKIAA